MLDRRAVMRTALAGIAAVTSLRGAGRAAVAASAGDVDAASKSPQHFMDRLLPMSSELGAPYERPAVPAWAAAHTRLHAEQSPGGHDLH